jgi:hypothetical protein
MPHNHFKRRALFDVSPHGLPGSRAAQTFSMRQADRLTLTDPNCNLVLHGWHLDKPAGGAIGPLPSEQAGSRTTLSSIGSITCKVFQSRIETHHGVKARACSSKFGLIEQNRGQGQGQGWVELR